MGADLYIIRLSNAARKKYQPKFDKACQERDKLLAEIEREKAICERTSGDAEYSPAAKASVRKMTLRIQSMTEQAEAHQAEVNKWYDKMLPDRGYFRDAYNGTSLFWWLGLSWWQEVRQRNQTVESLTVLLAKVKAAKLKPVTKKELRKRQAEVDDGENSPESWHRHFRNKRRRLISFLERCIKEVKAGGEVEFSV